MYLERGDTSVNMPSGLHDLLFDFGRRERFFFLVSRGDFGSTCPHFNRYGGCYSRAKSGSIKLTPHIYGAPRLRMFGAINLPNTHDFKVYTEATMKYKFQINSVEKTSGLTIIFRLTMVDRIKIVLKKQNVRARHIFQKACQHKIRVQRSLRLVVQYATHIAYF
jgi:hypothetical protein